MYEFAGYDDGPRFRSEHLFITSQGSLCAVEVDALISENPQMSEVGVETMTRLHPLLKLT